MAFHPLANLIDLYDGYCQPFRVQRHALVLIQARGRHYVIENRCPHMDAPLATGKVDDERIVCRAHGIAFELATGRAQGPLSGALDCLTFFQVVYEGNRIGVEL